MCLSQGMPQNYAIRDCGVNIHDEMLNNNPWGIYLVYTTDTEPAKALIQFRLIAPSEEQKVKDWLHTLPNGPTKDTLTVSLATLVSFLKALGFGTLFWIHCQKLQL